MTTERTAPEIDKTLVLSTAHVPGLSRTDDGRALHETPDLDVSADHEIRVSPHAYGWDVVLTVTLEDHGDLGLLTETGRDPYVPAWMKPAILLALSCGCRRISYDRDARPASSVAVVAYPGRTFSLPAYDW